jgi:hypothetical protein
MEKRGIVQRARDISGTVRCALAVREYGKALKGPTPEVKPRHSVTALDRLAAAIAIGIEVLKQQSGHALFRDRQLMSLHKRSQLFVP